MQTVAVSQKVSGTVLPGYEGVRSAFEENLASGEEVGASFAVYRNGKPVVDLWGGTAAKDGSEITHNTLYSVFSATKGVVSVCVAMLVDRGKLSYDSPMAAFWPEFASHGKAAITVGEMMSHQAGLVATRTPATMEDYYAHDGIAAALAEQEPYFLPGVFGYHPLTFGTLADELVRRTDGRTVNQFFKEEVAPMLDGDVFMGLPIEEDDRHVGMVGSQDSTTQPFDSPNPDALMTSLTNPIIDLDWPNQRRFREQGHPGAGASANARGLAKLYASLVCDGGEGDVPLLSKEVLKDATRERICSVDQCFGAVGRYAAGFHLNFGRMGSNPQSFGHPGMGGSVGFADPGRRLGIGYTTCRVLNPHWQWIDPRLARLLVAFYTAESAKDG